MESVSERLTTHSEEETAAAGEAFSKKLRPGEVVLLDGDLGAGKTKFVQGICKGLHVAEPVVSPTFTIVNQYSCRGVDGNTVRLYHIDCYRLSEPAHLQDTGIEEFLNGEGICFVEWPDLVRPLLNEPYWRVEIGGDADPLEREIRIQKVGLQVRDPESRAT